MKKTLAVIVLSAALVACNKPAQQATGGQQPATSQQAASMPQTGSQPALPPGHPAIPMATTAAAPAAAPAASAGNLSGVVTETMNSGGYTYLKIKGADGKEAWAAVQQTTVKKGQKVTVVEQMTAEKFQSNTLKRTFDRIVFGTIANAPAAAGAVPASMPPMPAGHPNMSSASAMGTPAQHMSGGGDMGDVKVERAEGGRTVAEVWANKSKLADQQVVVRGKVVKFLGGIMGKNWLHLRDGSGSAEKGDHDITVTTTDMATVGDVVTVSGAVRVDRDFGAGYRYPVIIEDAKVKK